MKPANPDHAHGILQAPAHDHRHRHDAHHQHTRDFPWDGEEPRAHPHVHEPVTHGHPHYPDRHRRHGH